jgi:hypothetical protein
MAEASVLQEGWYLMSARDLEIELARYRDPNGRHPRSNALRLSIEEALAYRDAGNLPDEMDRSLRLVLRIERPEDFKELNRRRLDFEPDYHDAPTWRRGGSRPVNIVPLPNPDLKSHLETWWDDAEVGELERTWAATGKVAGLRVPAAYRSFVYKTVVALQVASLPVTVDTVCDSVARWLPDRAEELRTALRQANEGPQSGC